MRETPGALHRGGLGGLIPGWWVALLAVALLAPGGCLLTARAESSPPPREEIEWLDVWVAGGGRMDLPRVLLIGDSITRGYHPNVEQALAGKALLGRLATSKSLGDPALLDEVRLVLSQTRYDVVHVSNGLHGWDYSDKAYARELPRLIEAIRKGAPGARIIWGTSTPIRLGGKPDLSPRNARVVIRNQIATGLLARDGVPIDDLYGFLADKPEFWSEDGVHLSPKGNAALGRRVAEVLSPFLGSRPAMKR